MANAQDPQRRAPTHRPAARLDSTVSLVEALWWYVAIGFVAVPFVSIWSLTGNIVIAIVATPVLVTALWWSGSRFVRWFRSI